MKNKLSKLLIALVLPMTLIIGTPCVVQAASTAEIIISQEEGNTLKVYTEPNELRDIIPFAMSQTYEHIIITGKMRHSDFRALDSISDNCKSIDLSGVEATEIPNGLFRGRDKLEKFIFPHNLKSIGAFSFQDCNNLSIDKLPENLEYIYECAFENCINLQLSVPDKTIIGEGTFYGCPNVQVTKIDLVKDDNYQPQMESIQNSTHQIQSANKSTLELIKFYINDFVKKFSK